MKIIEKLGFTSGPWEKDYGGTEHHIKSIGYKGDGTPTVCRYNDDFKNGGRSIIADNLTEDERQANGKLIAATPEILESLSNIIKIQNDPRESLTNLNRSIHNAEFLLIAKFPKIKELIK